jgi:hypothetical protein
MPAPTIPMRRLMSASPKLFGSEPPVVGCSLAANLPEKNGMDRI